MFCGSCGHGGGAQGSREDGEMAKKKSKESGTPRPTENVIGGNFPGFLEAAPDAIVIVGHDGRILIINGQAEKLFGYQRAELVGQPIELLVPARYRENHPG